MSKHVDSRTKGTPVDSRQHQHEDSRVRKPADSRKPKK